MECAYYLYRLFVFRVHYEYVSLIVESTIELMRYSKPVRLGNRAYRSPVPFRLSRCNRGASSDSSESS